MPGFFPAHSGRLEQRHILEKDGGITDETLNERQQLRVMGQVVQTVVVVDEVHKLAHIVLLLLRGKLLNRHTRGSSLIVNAIELRHFTRQQAIQPVQTVLHLLR